MRVHLAARAVDLLVETLGAALFPRQRGDDETRIGFALRPLGFGHDPAPAAPARSRHPHEGLEAARRGAGAPAGCSSKIEFGPDLGGEPFVLGETEEKVHAVGLAPTREVLPREA